MVQQVDETHDRQRMADSLISESAELDLDRFGHDDAIALGAAIVRRGQHDSLPIAVSIAFGNQLVFHAALAGTSADNDDWLVRKLNTVRRFDMPSLAVKYRFEAVGLTWSDAPHLDPALVALAGGGVPLRVRGSQIGVVAVSGLTDERDHDIVVEALRAACST